MLGKALRIAIGVLFLIVIIVSGVIAAAVGIISSIFYLGPLAERTK